MNAADQAVLIDKLNRIQQKMATARKMRMFGSHPLLWSDAIRVLDYRHRKLEMRLLWLMLEAEID